MLRGTSFFRLLSSFLIAAVCLAGVAFAANPTQNPAPPILPKQFAGWQMEGSPETSTNAAAADPTNVALLNEYGFTDFATATYHSDDGRTLKIRAARFADASGAFGAYAFYVRPGMALEEIGDRAASSGQRVLFRRGDILVDAVFSKMNAMSAAALRELAGDFPLPPGNSGTLPPILAYMPRHGLREHTEKYAEGPLGLGAIGSPVDADLVDFSSSPEVAVGQYSIPGGEATLMLIEYPTPAVAAEHLRRIDLAHHAAQPPAGVSAVENVGPFFDKRTGPIIAIAAGPLSASDAQALLGAVNYEASVTWNQNTYFDKKNNIANLLFNIILLCIIVGAISLAAGVAFGGVRILLRRYFPGRLFGDADRTEFIALHLEDGMADGPASSGGSTKRSVHP